jgi:hypothetical protein
MNFLIGTNIPLTSQNNLGTEVSMLPNTWTFIATSIISASLYYTDMITDIFMLLRFHRKLTQSSENSTRRAYSFFFYSNLFFTIFPIVCLAFFSVLKSKWKNLTWYKFIGKIIMIFAESILNIGLIKL